MVCEYCNGWGEEPEYPGISCRVCRRIPTQAERIKAKIKKIQKDSNTVVIKLQTGGVCYNQDCEWCSSIYCGKQRHTAER